MHILTVNISQPVTYIANIAIANTSEVACGLSLAYLHLTIAHSKGQDQAHFDCVYLTNDRTNITISHMLLLLLLLLHMMRLK